MRIFVLILSLAMTPALSTAGELPHSEWIQNQGAQYVPPKPKKGFRYPDCFCTDSTGKRIDLGKTTCLKIGSQSFTARCAMSLNNPTWRRVSDGCPSV
ncbi:MAG: hypothetical protein AAF334_05445 [Pseudomonadota bacterium]